jgi:iron complex transport system substrate-binding protein
MKRFFQIFSAIVLICLIFSACAPAATPVPTAAATVSTSIVVKDGLGRSVTLAAPAKNVVSMAPSNTEILFALGAAAQVIGRDEFSDYPVEAKALPSIGGSMGKYDLEKIASLKPDLVLASQLNTPEQVKALEDLKLTVFYLSNPTDINGLYGNLEMVGKLVGKNAEAKQLNTSLQKRVQVITDASGKVSQKTKIFYELDATDPAKPWTAGPGSFIDMLISMSGGENVAAKLKGDYAQISQEELLAVNPEIILLGDGAYGITADMVAKRPGWEGILAVKNNKILTFDDNLVSRPSPRLVDGLEILFKLIHP